MRRLTALAGLTGVLFALGVGVAVRWTTPAAVADLRPRPDALEYEEAARNLAHGDGYVLVLDGGRFPPRYPPGLSALIAPVLALWGDAPGTGVLVVQATALLAVAATAWLAHAGGGASAVAAALFLALAPLHVRWARAVMSDVPASAAVALLAVGVLAAAERGARLRTWLGLGAAVGLAGSLRATLLLLVPAALPLLLATRRLRAAVALVAGATLVVVSGLLFDPAVMGSYGFWLPGARLLDPRFVLAPPDGGGSGPNGPFYARLLLGMGSLYPWPVAVLIALGTLQGMTRPGRSRGLVVLGLGFTLALAAVQMGYHWQWDRFLLPALPLLLAVAALPLGAARPLPRLGAGALAVLALAMMVRFPGAWAPPDPDRGEVAALRALDAAVEPNAAVILRSHPFLVRRVLRGGTDRVWVPLGLCEHRLAIAWHRLAPVAPAPPDDWMRAPLVAPLAPAVVEAEIAALVAEGRPVYLATLLAREVPFLDEVLRLLGARWRRERVPLAGAAGALFRLRP